MDEFIEDGHTKLLLVKISKSLDLGIDLYDATRGVWKVAPDRASQADLVLGIQQGLVVSVFVPHSWKPATNDEFPRHGEVAPGRVDFSKRHAFDGVPAEKTVAAKYLGKRVPDRLAFGQGPFRYNW